jgi:hypothetical protein
VVIRAEEELYFFNVCRVRTVDADVGMELLLKVCEGEKKI